MTRLRFPPIKRYALEDLGIRIFRAPDEAGTECYIANSYCGESHYMFTVVFADGDTLELTHMEFEANYA